MATKIPTLDQLQQYDVNRRGEYEGIRQTLYDSATYATAGQTQLQFFQIPQGQSSKTIADTNMKAAGQLPQPQHFLVESIEIHVFPGVNPVITDEVAVAESEFTNDMYTLAKSGSLDFFIGSKSYLEEAPIGRFPPKTKMEPHFGVHFETATAEQVISMDYAAWVGRPYYLDPPVLLVPNQNWNVNLNWPTAVATPSGEDARIVIILDGILYRQSQ